MFDGVLGNRAVSKPGSARGCHIPFSPPEMLPRVDPCTELGQIEGGDSSEWFQTDALSNISLEVQEGFAGVDRMSGDEWNSIPVLGVGGTDETICPAVVVQGNQLLFLEGVEQDGGRVDLEQDAGAMHADDGEMLMCFLPILTPCYQI